MILTYLKDKRKPLCLLLCSTGIFAIVFYLYGMPFEAAGYAGLLCFAFLAVVGLFDFLRFCKKHRQLTQLNVQLFTELCALPPPEKLLEADYHRLLAELLESRRQLISKADGTRSEMLDFYTLWVHQIKTPIAAMHLLLQEEDTAKNAQLGQELFRIERYTELVLGYLRIASLSEDLQIASCDLEPIVKRAVKKYAPLFIHKKIALELLDLDFCVLTDEKWLCFVIEQLLSNALKYTPSGKIRIFSEEGTVLVIEDTGIGISAEDLPRVFERGFTGFNGRMDQKSTGLGLYLCKRTLVKLGHPITLRAEPGRGTTVRITFLSDKLSPI